MLYVDTIFKMAAAVGLLLLQIVCLGKISDVAWEKMHFSHATSQIVLTTNRLVAAQIKPHNFVCHTNCVCHKICKIS